MGVSSFCVKSHTANTYDFASHMDPDATLSSALIPNTAIDNM